MRVHLTAEDHNLDIATRKLSRTKEGQERFVSLTSGVPFPHALRLIEEDRVTSIAFFGFRFERGQIKQLADTIAERPETPLTRIHMRDCCHSVDPGELSKLHTVFPHVSLETEFFGKFPSPKPSDTCLEGSLSASREQQRVL